MAGLTVILIVTAFAGAGRIYLSLDAARKELATAKSQLLATQSKLDATTTKICHAIVSRQLQDNPQLAKSSDFEEKEMGSCKQSFAAA